MLGLLNIVIGGGSFLYFFISTNVECAEGPWDSDDVPISSVKTFGLP